MKATKIVGGLLALGLSGLGVMPAQALVYTQSSTTKFVVDGNTIPAGSVNIGAGTVTDVSIALTFIKCASQRDSQDPSIITDPGLSLPLPTSFLCPFSGDASPNEIGFALTSPTGTTIDLIVPDFLSYLTGGGGQAITVTLRDDALLDFVGLNGYVSEEANALTGPFFAFAGEEALGPWALTMTDSAAPDPLGLYGFTLNVTVADTQNVPEPGTLALLGLGLAGLGALKRRR